MNEIESPTPSLRSRVVATPTFGGLCGGLLLWFQSLTPTLIPRPWIAQSVISGVCLAIGYGFGAAVGYWLGQLLDRSSHSPGHLARQRWWLALGVGWLIAVSVGATLWLRWQNDQRGLMAMAPLDWFAAVFMVPLSGVVGLLLVIVGRTIGGGIRALNRKIEHRVSNPLAAIAALLLVVVLGVAIGGGAVFRGLTALANSAYASQNDETSDGISAPTSPSVSGSDESLVPWETLGRTGRDFVATATTPSQLETFHGPDAELVDPVRVYVGVQSADSLQDRAELAVRELERAGGFEREVLVVWVPTGSGWMIPEAAAALEQLYRGDTAIVAIQYSFLPSILAVFMDPGLAIEFRVDPSQRSGGAMVEAASWRSAETAHVRKEPRYVGGGGPVRSCGRTVIGCQPRRSHRRRFDRRSQARQSDPLAAHTRARSWIPGVAACRRRWPNRAFRHSRSEPAGTGINLDVSARGLSPAPLGPRDFLGSRRIVAAAGMDGSTARLRRV